MPTHSEERFLPYQPEDLFDLVADIESYPKFLPWCSAARINDRDGDIVFAELVINFKAFRESYISRVELHKDTKEISVSLVQGPFQHLQNEWKFSPHGKGTMVEFDIDFAFRSKILEKLISNMFLGACKKMIAAFEARAKTIYGHDKRL